MASPRLSITICCACMDKYTKGLQAQGEWSAQKRGGGVQMLVSLCRARLPGCQSQPCPSRCRPACVLAEMSAMFSRRQKERWKAGCVAMKVVRPAGRGAWGGQQQLGGVCRPSRQRFPKPFWR